MSWFKLDDKLHSSPKLLSIPRKHRLAALGLWTLAASWSADQLTDGHVPSYMIDEWGGSKLLVGLLVEAGLWVPAPDGAVFHNWSKYQPTKADVEEQRRRNAEKVANWRARKANGDGEQDPNNEVTNAHVTGLPTRNSSVSNSAPDPTRPDPSFTEAPSGASGSPSSLPSSPAAMPTKARRDVANHGSRLVHAFIERHPETVWPSKVKSDLMARVTACVQDGIPDDIIARGLDLWDEQGYPASTLGNSIVQVQRAANGAAAPGTRPRRPSPSERAAATLALADQLEGTDHERIGHRTGPRQIATGG